MSDHSNIEWTDATWNPITGCSVTSPGCRNCYAMKLAGTRLRHHPSREGLTQPSAAGPVWTGEVRLNEEWIEQPLHWGRPRMIFVCAHGDLFHESVPDVWIDRVFAVMALAKPHTFQVLTKRAARMLDYCTDPLRATAIGVQVSRLAGPEFVAEFGDPCLPLRNVWLGVSAENQVAADERVPLLARTPAAVRWVSAEPMLGPIDLRRYIARHCERHPGELDTDGKCEVCEGRGIWELGDGGLTEAEQARIVSGLDWVICGGESGPNARLMMPDWARSLREQCAAAGVQFMFKQWGEWMPIEVDCSESVAGDGSDRNLEGLRFEVATLPDHQMGKVGKKVAGRLLDGVLHNAFPKVRP
jgi:protein gp37